MLVVMQDQDQDFSSFYTHPFRYFMLLIQERARRLIISHKNETKGKCQAGLTCSLRCSTKLFTFVHAFLFFQLLVFGSQLALGQEWDGIIITQADYQALEAFKHELVDPKGYLKSWNDTGYGACSGNWLGIKCAQGQVIVIKLPLKGLSGRVTEKIGQFQALRKLSLHDNDIGGSIPTSLGFLPNLRGVQLYNNRFSGSIPASLGLCPVLQTLELSNNSLSGTIPVSLVNSTKLYRLNVSYNSLTGTIPESITESSSLIFIDLQHNNLSGSIPDTWGGNGERLFLLQSLTLNHNSFSGNIPVSLSKLIELLEISLSHNRISGVIPDDIGRLTRLRTLDLSHNNLTGEIPMSLNDLPNLSSFNISYNFLSGPVPAHLAQKFNSSAFSGNLQLCGYNNASAPCPKTPSPVKRGSKLRIKDIILIVVGTLIIILFLLCCILLCCLIKKRAAVKAEKGVKGVAATAEEVEAAGETGGKLVHFDGPITFSADDLLCATADILGKSTYGTVYKATLEDGNQVAVKRLREKITKGQKEFEKEVNVLGKIRHPNLLALRAYYLGTKGEKLLVFDYMPKGSIATFLHARSPDTPIDWPTRMRIAKGMTRGLLYLHTNANIIHGNLTSSNVLLDENTNANIADYGLSRLVTPAANANVVATAGALGYRAPELSKLKKANVKTDVYSLGVIVLELLTGKSPGEATDGVDLPTRVASIVKVEGTSEVFDLELMRDASIIGDELLNTLKLALHCVDPSPSARPEVQRILQQLEEIRPERSASSGDDRAAPAAPSASD